MLENLSFKQISTAKVPAEIDGELALLKQQRDRTRALKHAMMQELHTGRTRLI
jgi:type I restriction enzyme S subunit